MRTAVIVPLLLLISMSAGRLDGRLPQADVKSPELEEAARLSLEAVSRFDDNKFDDALKPAKQALEIREKVLGREHELVASSLNQIADIYVAQQKYEVAEPFYKRSLAILEKKWGPESKFLTSTIESLAIVRFAVRDNGAAEKLYMRSLAIKEKALGPNDPGLEKTIKTIGVFYERIDKPGKALEYFKRSLAVKEKQFGSNSPNLIEPLYNCACALIAANKSSDAQAYKSRAASIVTPLEPTNRGVLQGSAIYRFEPEYPIEARRRRVSGTVVVQVTVDECGRVTDAKGITGPVDLVDPATRAARQWRFTPTKMAGRPVRVIGTLTFNFHL